MTEFTLNGNGAAEPTVIHDKLENVVSGLGTIRDKSVFTRWSLPVLDISQLEAAYRGDWIVRKIVDIPAKDATREWRDWQAEDDQIEAIEAIEEKFDLPNVVKSAITKARLYGGAAIVLGVEDGRSPEEELDLERVKKDSLKFLHVVPQHQMGSQQLNWDLMSPFYMEPEYYQRTLPSGQMLRIHPSRVVRVIGCEFPDERNMIGSQWGDSIVQIVMDAVLAAGTAASGIAALVTEAKTDIIKFQDLSRHIGTKEYEGKLIARLQSANLLKSMINTTVLDKEEEWEQRQIHFGTLPDILKMYLLIASGAADIPVTRMMGQSPAGMNATGESDIRNYYDRVRADQNSDLRPLLARRLDQVIVRSALGTYPDELYYEWGSLWQLTDVEKADLATKKAATFKQDLDMGLINPDALRKVRINQLIEDGTYPGIEAAIEEFGEEPEEQDDEEILAAFGEMQKRQKQVFPNADPKVMPFKKKAATGDNNPYHDPETGEFTSGPSGPQTNYESLERWRNSVTLTKEQKIKNAESRIRQIRYDWKLYRGERSVDDYPYDRGAIHEIKAYQEFIKSLKDSRFNDARPRTLYVRRQVLNADAIVAWAKDMGFATTLAPEDMRVTIAFSKQPIDWSKIGEDFISGPTDGNLRIKPGGMRLVETLGDPTKPAHVLMFSSYLLSARHGDIRGAGASWDWDDYQPHITISYSEATGPALEPYRGEIILGPEIFEEVKDDHQA